VLVPPLVRRKSESGVEGVRRLAGAMTAAVLAVLAVVGLAAMLAAPGLLKLLTMAVSDPQIRAGQIALGAPLLLMLMPQLVLYGIAGVGLAVQQTYGRFGLPAIAPACENVVSILVLVSSAYLFGFGGDVGNISVAQLMWLGLGTTMAAAIHAAVQWIGAWRVGVPIWPRFTGRDPDLGAVLSRGASSVGYSGLYWAGYLSILVITGTVPGGVAAFQIATAFCYLPVALISVPLAAAQLPRLTKKQAVQEMLGFGRMFESGLRLLLFAIVPAALIATALPQMLAGAGAFGAMSSPAGIALIAACLGGLGFGMIGEGVFIFASSACYALHDTAGPFRAMAVRLGIAVTIAVTARMTVVSGEALMWTLGASLSIANAVGALYLSRRLRQAFPAEATRSNGFVSALLVGAMAVTPALVANWRIGSTAELAGYQRLGLALILAGLTLIVYLTIQFLRRSHEFALLVPRLARRDVVHPLTAGD
jgi:putative peptidoglycan lipid II flippase